MLALLGVESVFSGNVVAGDPSVVRLADGTYRMSYTDADLDPLSHPIIGVVESSDGLVWSPIETPDPDPGIVLRGRTSDEAVETSALIQTGSGWLLYATTYYTPVGDYTIPGYFIPAETWLLVGDGASFSWWTHSVLENEPQWYSNDGAYAPSIIYEDGRFVMAFNGFCYSDCPLGSGGFILMAESFNGVDWILWDDPVIGPGTWPWMYGGVEDPFLAKHGDEYLLFFGGDSLADTASIGMAYSDSLSGPWTIVEEPVITREPGTSYSFQVRAPSVVMEGDDVRMWFTGAEDGNVFSIHHGRAPLESLR